MLKTKKENQEVEITEDILCNMCGRSCLKGQIQQLKEEYGLTHCVVNGGFFSSVLQDMTAYKFDLCEECLVDIFKKFTIPVEEKEEYN